MKRQIFDKLIDDNLFSELLITEMGWNNPLSKTPIVITIDGKESVFTPIADKNGFHVYSCNVNDIPNASECKKIDTKLCKHGYDYICIFVEHSIPKHQLWLVPVKTNEKRELVKTEYIGGQQAGFLFSKINDLSFDLTESVTIVEVKTKIQGAFQLNSEKVTGAFYKEFRKEHDTFKTYIKGLDDTIPAKDNKKKDWYASVMLNRLMFCYFVQKKGFLNFDSNYLRNKLKWMQEHKGENKFYQSFYKDFLCALFHDGLNSPKHDTPEFTEKYGRIPYLNGGMFDYHQLEREYKIDIDDIAFEKLFDFFDKWNWHLDTRLTASGKDINPDVLGYIFEQYINDRAAMGAYYTKEDITEYISKNCIIPFLMDKTEEKSADAFKPQGEVWSLLKKSGDTYIYDAVKKGYSADWQQKLPDYISYGIDTVTPNLLERRSRWNEKTFEEFALPTEIWRETVNRLQRCDSLLAKISSGEITNINDFITYNLDIRQFAEDILRNTENHIFILHFYQVLQSVTILDPTCGSGAFLFAALNILEPLYEVCLDRMEEWHNSNPKLFNQQLAEVAEKYGNNRQYFIYKSIILRNLYGVDIMVEATEIAKLRLFLKMVAVVEVDKRKDNLGLDPLPDVDFNIKCGNTLVGYATEKELNNAISPNEDMFASLEFKETIDSEMKLVAKAYNLFRQEQLRTDDDNESIKATKEKLKTRLSELNDLLNQHMYKCVTGNNVLKNGVDLWYKSWLDSHQPFHWLAEYYQIIKGNGGFDVIIGNPPYVEYSSIKSTYTVKNIDCLSSGNLYAFVIERSINISHIGSRNGMIIQMSAFCTPRMESFQKIWLGKANYSAISFFDDRPWKLFDNLQHIRVVIPLAKIGKCNNIICTTGYNKFYSECRNYLFKTLYYYPSDKSHKDFSVLKIQSSCEEKIVCKLWKNKNQIATYENKSANLNYVFYGYGYGYFGKILNYKSYFKSETNKESTGDKYYYIRSQYDKDVFVGILNSSLFYWFYINFSDGHNFTKTVIGHFPYDYSQDKEIIKLVDELMNDLKANMKLKNAYYKTTGHVEYNEYYPKKSKHIIDKIDRALAEHYGLSEEELDFIVNYDIKYRMGE